MVWRPCNSYTIVRIARVLVNVLTTKVVGRREEGKSLDFIFERNNIGYFLYMTMKE